MYAVALLPQGNAVSSEAQYLQRTISERCISFEQSESLFGKKSQVIEELREVSEECSLDDWDGYGAKAVSDIAIARAERFLRLLPNKVDMPEVSVGADGNVTFEWIPSSIKTLVLSFGLNNRIPYAWSDGSDQGHAVAKLYDDEIPERLLKEIQRMSV